MVIVQQVFNGFGFFILDHEYIENMKFVLMGSPILKPPTSAGLASECRILVHLASRANTRARKLLSAPGFSVKSLSWGG